MANFCSNYVPIFQKFCHDLLPNFHQIWPKFQDFLEEIKLGHIFTDFFFFFFGKIHGISPYILHMWSSSTQPPALLVGAPKLVWFHQFMECVVMRILQPNYEKKCWKGAPFWKRYLSWNTRVKGTLEWRGTLRVPPQPGCPRVCPTLSP